MPLLYYWRDDNYRHDLDYGVGYHLNQANPLLHKVELGDSVWAFTRALNGVYALGAELVVSAKTGNPPGYRYGQYRVWGDLQRSRYFAVNGQLKITPLIRSLHIAAGGDVLGRAFQGRAAVRRITEADHTSLTAYVQRLSLEARARLLPEEQLEALLVSGDEVAVKRLLRDEPSGLAEARRLYLVAQAAATTRDRRLVVELRDLYAGACQLCGWAPRQSYGTDLCEAHHVRWLSRGGPDEIANLLLVCLNHHRAIHRLDAPFDYRIGGFVFGMDTERLRFSEHELVA